MPVGAPKPARRHWAAVRRPGTGWLAAVAGKTPHQVAQTEHRQVRRASRGRRPLHACERQGPALTHAARANGRFAPRAKGTAQRARRWLDCGETEGRLQRAVGGNRVSSFGKPRRRFRPPPRLPTHPAASLAFPPAAATYRGSWVGADGSAAGPRSTATKSISCSDERNRESTNIILRVLFGRFDVGNFGPVWGLGSRRSPPGSINIFELSIGRRTLEI